MLRHSWWTLLSLTANRVPAGYRLVLDSIVTVNADAPPRLGISLPAPNKLQIDWSTNVTGYIVETSPNLELDGWTPVTNRVDVVRGMFSVTVETPGALGYFRLRQRSIPTG